MRKLHAALALPVVLATSGCDAFLDVNKDPNAPVSARIDLTLPAVVGVFGHSVLAGSLAFWTAEWMQQFSFNGNNRSYSNVHRYELTSIDANNPWNAGFSTVMKEAKNLMTEAEATEAWAYNGIAKFIFSWTYSLMTDAWGPVPFSEAFQPAIRDPKYDDQKVVYEGLFKLLDESIADMQKQTARPPTTNDLLYQGDMAKWVKLANVIKAEWNLRLSSAPGENRQTRAQAALTALQSGFSSNADDADFQYPGGSGRRNPWYTFRNNDPSFVSAAYFIDALLQRNDPRISVFARPAPSDTPNIVYRGHVSGSGSQTTNQFSRIGNFFQGDSAFLNWVSYSHAKFIEAEARLIVSGAAAADAPYRAAIRANMQKLAVPDSAIDRYLAARPPLASVANALEEIIREKYVANFLKFEVWNDWRRTGYPRVTAVQSEYLTQIPQRIRSPDNELNNNAKNIAATGIPPGLSGMTVKVWWASGTN